MQLTRRELVTGAGAAMTLAAFSTAAVASAPLAGKQATGVYRTKVGTIEFTSLLNAHIDIPLGEILGAEQAADETKRLLERAMLPVGPMSTPINAFLVNNNGRLTLIDTGLPRQNGGDIVQQLAAAGVKPAQIDTVLVTHMHGDHAGGLLDAHDKPVFVNAELLIPARELAYWGDESEAAKLPVERRTNFARIPKLQRAYAKRITPFEGEREVVSGIHAVALYGHTPGHTGYRITSGNEDLLLWADITHATALQFAHPDWCLVYDVDKTQSAATRKRAFDMVSSDKTLIAGSHLPFPAQGRVARDGDVYRFVPANWSPL